MEGMCYNFSTTLPEPGLSPVEQLQLASDATAARLRALRDAGLINTGACDEGIAAAKQYYEEFSRWLQPDHPKAGLPPRSPERLIDSYAKMLASLVRQARSRSMRMN